MTKRATGSEELRRITDALDESILNASPAQLVYKRDDIEVISDKDAQDLPK